MLNEKLEKLLNEQFNLELYSAYTYLAMAAYMDHRSLDGFAHWMKLQESDAATQQAMLSQPEKRGGSRRRNRRRRTGKDSDGGAG